MNDPNTIYIAHSDDSSHEGSNILVPSSTDSSALSKKVVQNRAAQRAFRERKKHFVEDLENKAKQLDECKKAMIQLQADNDYLRKSVVRLEDQLKQYTVTHSIPLTKPFLPPPPPTPSLHPLLPSPFPSIPPPLPSPSPSLTNPQYVPLSSFKSPPSPPVPSSSSSTSSSATPSSSLASHPSSQAKPLSPLSKREKKRQRLLIQEKLHKNDDLEPIQLHCPYPCQQQEQQQSTTHNIKNESIVSGTIIPTSPGPSVVPNPTSFLQSLATTTTTMDAPQDQYIHFVEDTNRPLSQ